MPLCGCKHCCFLPDFLDWSDLAFLHFLSFSSTDLRLPRSSSLSGPGATLLSCAFSSASSSSAACTPFPLPDQPKSQSSTDIHHRDCTDRSRHDYNAALHTNGAHLCRIYINALPFLEASAPARSCEHSALAFPFFSSSDVHTNPEKEGWREAVV